VTGDAAIPERPSGWPAAARAAGHVFLVDLAEWAVVDALDGHHLQRVRRLRPGEHVTAGDGQGAWRRYEIETIGRGRLTLVATGPVTLEPVLEPQLAVAFALTKGAKPEHVVAQLTELGVERLAPVRARRSVVRWEGDRARVATDRLRRVVREAAMQCRRSRLPDVGEPVGLDALAGHPGLLLGDRAGESAQALSLPAGGEWLLVVGPEGGFEPDELARLDRAQRVGVGPHVLRADTAAVAVAAALTSRRREGSG
jgi:16S rRNA (uracil1498-N3)-methyltransferase